MAIIAITSAHLDLLVANLIRTPQVLRLALDRLQPEDFNYGERAHAVVWASLRDHFRAHSLVPGRQIIRSDVQTRMSANPEWAMDVQLATSIDGLLESAYTLEDQYLVPPLAMEVLQKLLDERQVRKALAAAPGATIPELITSINERFVKTRLTGARVRNPFDLEDAENTTQSTAPHRATGNAVFDELTHGGPRAGECISVLGPIGGGKTLTLVNTAVDAAQTWQEPVLFLTYEQSYTEIRERIWTFTTRLHRHRIQAKGFADLDPETQAKVRNASERLKHLELVDMCEDGIGYGGISEVEALVQDRISQGRKPAMVVIDWLGIAVSRWLGISAEGSNDDSFRYRQGLNMFAIGCRDMAKKFDITLMHAHQLSADAGSKGVTAKHNVYSSSDSRMIATTAAVQIIVGTRHPTQNILQMQTVKNRGGGQVSFWCKSDPDCHQLIPSNQEYVSAVGRDGNVVFVPQQSAQEVGGVKYASGAVSAIDKLGQAAGREFFDVSSPMTPGAM